MNRLNKWFGKIAIAFVILIVSAETTVVSARQDDTSRYGCDQQGYCDDCYAELFCTHTKTTTPATKKIEFNRLYDSGGARPEARPLGESSNGGDTLTIDGKEYTGEQIVDGIDVMRDGSGWDSDDPNLDGPSCSCSHCSHECNDHSDQPRCLGFSFVQVLESGTIKLFGKYWTYRGEGEYDETVKSTWIQEETYTKEKKHHEGNGKGLVVFSPETKVTKISNFLDPSAGHIFFDLSATIEVKNIKDEHGGYFERKNGRYSGRQDVSTQRSGSFSVGVSQNEGFNGELEVQQDFSTKSEKTPWPKKEVYLEREGKAKSPASTKVVDELELKIDANDTAHAWKITVENQEEEVNVEEVDGCIPEEEEEEGKK